MGFYPKQYQHVIGRMLPTLLGNQNTKHIPQCIDTKKMCSLPSPTNRRAKLYTVEHFHTIESFRGSLVAYEAVTTNVLGGLNFTKYFNQTPVFAEYIVKYTPVTSYQQVLAAMKEGLLMNEIDTLTCTLKQPRRLVCKPLFAGLCRFGNSWQYALVMEKPVGQPLSGILLTQKLSKMFSKWTSVSPCKVHALDKTVHSLRTTLYCLWWLGYSHNDLCPENVLYDEVTNTATLMNLEFCVAIPLHVVMEFRQALGQRHQWKPSTDENDIYRCIIQRSALSILKIGEQYLDTTTRKNKVRTDDAFIASLT